jgi:indole-3-glycerol phosphate synthase
MTILERIVAAKWQEIIAAQQRRPRAELERQLADVPAPRDFRAALQQVPPPALIAEIKKASPSAGVLCQDFNAAALATTYARCGAAALSVLTDAPFFQGHLDHLRQVRQAVSLPLLRKDFILDEYQLLEARLAGADAVLLIAEILPGSRLTQLRQEAEALGLQALVEIHERDNLLRALDSGARLLGINNRDLRTFTTRLEHTLELAPLVPREVCLVSESGIRTRQDVLRLQAAGVQAVLVGETLMRAANLKVKMAELLGQSV